MEGEEASPQWDREATTKIIACGDSDICSTVPEVAPTEAMEGGHSSTSGGLDLANSESERNSTSHENKHHNKIIVSGICDLDSTVPEAMENERSSDSGGHNHTFSPNCNPYSNSSEHRNAVNVETDLVVDTQFCNDSQVTNSDDSSTLLEKKSDNLPINNPENQDGLKMSNSLCQAEQDHIKSLQTGDICTSSLETDFVRFKGSDRENLCTVSLESLSDTGDESNVKVLDANILHDESVVEFSRDRISDNVIRLEGDSKHLKEENKRTKDDIEECQPAPYVYSENSSDNNSDTGNSKSNQDSGSKSDLIQSATDNPDTEIKSAQVRSRDSILSERVEGSSEDTEDVSGSRNVCSQRREDSMDSGSGSGYTGGPSSSTSIPSSNTSGLDRVGSSDSSGSVESGGTGFDEGGCRTTESRGMLLSEIETLVGGGAAAGRVSPDSADFEVAMLDFSSTPKHNLMKMLSGLLDECDALKKEKARLDGEVSRLEADTSSQVYSAQIHALEKSLAQAEADACSWKEAVQEGERKHTIEMVRVREDLTGRVERLTTQFQAANKDKESMVIKYATAEREVIQVRKQKEGVERRVKDLEKEREQLMGKNKMLVSERARICQTLDTKIQRNNWYQREMDRLKEEVSARDIKIKWAQTKLKTEMDAHQECQSKLDRALTKIVHHEAELKEVKEKAEGFVRATLDDQKSRANVLDMQLKEEKARVILERQVNEDRGSAYSRVNADLEALMKKYGPLEEEATSLRARVASLECEREESEKLFASLRAEVTNARQEASQLSLQLANTSHIQQQLNRERESSTAANQEVEQLQETQVELEAELETCRTKEAELLAFTQKLSDKNVLIQSQFTALQSKSQLVEVERGEAATELEEARQQLSRLKTDLSRHTHSHTTQVSDLQRELGEKSEECEKLKTLVMDLKSEIQVLNRKHANSLKDLSREMQKLRRRIEQHEEGGGGGDCMMVGGSGRSSQAATPHDTLSHPSPASSNTSLNTLEYNNSAHNGNHPVQQDGVLELVVPQQVLVERIVRLQRAAARRAEKIEFLEEHVVQLVGELKKKSRIIHHYIMKEEAGALSSSASDLSKAEMVRHGGIMASVYGSSPRDASMTLELSLEINTKLQAVLEDTLLKNITLKENLNTLGDEIAKISHQNQQIGNQK